MGPEVNLHLRKFYFLEAHSSADDIQLDGKCF